MYQLEIKDALADAVEHYLREMPEEIRTPALFAFREYVTDKASFGFDADGARIGETPNIAMDAGTPELASLIAAAPDLLEALEAALPWIEAKEGTSDANDLIVDAVRAAIAKARENAANLGEK